MVLLKRDSVPEFWKIQLAAKFRVTRIPAAGRGPFSESKSSDKGGRYAQVCRCRRRSSGRLRFCGGRRIQRGRHQDRRGQGHVQEVRVQEEGRRRRQGGRKDPAACGQCQVQQGEVQQG